VRDLARAARGDRQCLRRAVQAVKWLDGRPELLAPLVRLLEETEPDVRTYVVECLGHLKLPECVEPIIAQIEESFENAGESAGELRESAIRALGVNRHESAVDYLTAILYETGRAGAWSDDERSLAAESLIQFALGGSMRALEILAGGLESPDRLVKELSQSAMLVISERKVWDGRGYHSFTANIERADRDGPSDR
jgi:HEAT repeat protein